MPKSTNEPSWAQKSLQIRLARQKQTLLPLLKDHYHFRVYFLMKSAYRNGGIDRVKQHLYGFEEDVSYSQCFNGHATEIKLSKIEGWKNAMKMVQDKKGKYHKAVIYSRSINPYGLMDTVHRTYGPNGEEVGDVQDPVIWDTDVRTFYFTNFKQYLIVHPEKVPDPEWLFCVFNGIDPNSKK